MKGVEACKTFYCSQVSERIDITSCSLGRLFPFSVKGWPRGGRGPPIRRCCIMAVY